jgi:glutaminase
LQLFSSHRSLKRSVILRNIFPDHFPRKTGRRLSWLERRSLNTEVYESATRTNDRNQSIARLLQSYGRIYLDAANTTDLYTKQCSLNVSARDLVLMSATLAEWWTKSLDEAAGR